MTTKHRYREITMSVRLPCTVTMTVRQEEGDDTWELASVRRVDANVGIRELEECIDADDAFGVLDELANKAEDIEV